MPHAHKTQVLYFRVTWKYSTILYTICTWHSWYIFYRTFNHFVICRILVRWMLYIHQHTIHTFAVRSWAARHNLVPIPATGAPVTKQCDSQTIHQSTGNACKILLLQTNNSITLFNCFCSNTKNKIQIINTFQLMIRQLCVVPVCHLHGIRSWNKRPQFTKAKNCKWTDKSNTH
jgi:hypothetical protein